MTIALLTDFGLRDPYVAAVKGVLASGCDVPVADLSHELEPFDVFAAAWFLRSAAPFWPEGTIFVAVVDPGVGSSRRILAAESGGKRFLAPDNGLLSMVLPEAAVRIVSVENESFFLRPSSNTFHGRDRFAPVAAALASGHATVADLGPSAGAIVRLDYEPPVYDERRADGTVVAVDRYGNVVTDLEASRIGFRGWRARCGGAAVERTASSYAEMTTGEPHLIVGSQGTIEISLREASAAAALGISRSARIALETHD